jgi:hypothetical protein
VRSILSLHLLSVLCLALLTAGPSQATEDLTVKLPAAGEYLVWVEAQTASGTQAQAPVRVTGDRAALTLPAPPAGLKAWQALALDEKSGYVAAKNLPAKDTPTEVSFSTPDFNRVHRVRVQVTGAGEKPVAGASVTLTDAKGGSLSRVIDATAAGTAEFTDVPTGAAKLAVTASGGKSTTKDIDVNLPKGETVQTIAVPLPEVTAVVEAPAAPATGATSSSAPSPSTAEGQSTTGGATDTSTSTDAGEKGAAPSQGGGGLGTLVGLILVAGIGYLLYLKGKNEGWTVDKILARLGVQPVSPAPAGGPSPAAVGGQAAPAAPPVDPNVCAFCGQRKDPVTGACACSLDAASTSSSAPTSGGLGGASGPRLVAVSGVAMGQIYPVMGEATIGRDPGNAVSLSMDSSVSRRHAVITTVDGGYVIQDQGSSNGTFVNGARVTEAPLRPGDEVSIGGTRFRFEA